MFNRLLVASIQKVQVKRTLLQAWTQELIRMCVGTGPSGVELASPSMAPSITTPIDRAIELARARGLELKRTYPFCGSCREETLVCFCVGELHTDQIVLTMWNHKSLVKPVRLRADETTILFVLDSGQSSWVEFEKI